MRILLIAAVALFVLVAVCVAVGLYALDKFDEPFADDGDWGLG